MATVNITFTTKKQALPSSPPASGNIRVQLIQAGLVKATQNSGVAAPTASFTGVADGDYTVAVQRMDMQNLPMGSPAVSASFTVVNTTEVDVPDVVSVSV